MSGRINNYKEGEQKFKSGKIMSDGIRVELNNFTVKFNIFCPELSMILFKVIF